VAGLKPTLDFMRRFGGLKEFCKRHRVDILCLQEAGGEFYGIFEGFSGDLMEFYGD
jgi:mRNA deadenylase 3'-5' endonuclease subunit Ccr4